MQKVKTLPSVQEMCTRKKDKRQAPHPVVGGEIKGKRLPLRSRE